MRETWYCIYHCYCLSFKSGTEEKMLEEAARIQQMSEGEAGKDGRRMKFYFVCKKEKFLNLIAEMMV